TGKGCNVYSMPATFWSFRGSADRFHFTGQASYYSKEAEEDQGSVGMSAATGARLESLAEVSGLLPPTADRPPPAPPPHRINCLRRL
ncbi:hypothetical protein BgiBS90_006001, partial [Biomphalaria glabrata]